VSFPVSPADLPRPRRVTPRRLGDLLPRLGEDLEVAGASLDGVMVTGITHDSRRVRPGDLYAALPGSATHGVTFAGSAVAAGAVGLLTDPAGRQAGRDAPEAIGVPVLVVADVRGVLGPVSAWVYGNPADELLLLGVTGTNGKTTTAYLLEAGLAAAGHVTGLIGTIETRMGALAMPSARTTPEAPDLHALFAAMAEHGVSAVAMEVSSHALALGRVGGTRFDVAVFTNLSQDHLDFHVDMASYFAAKARLFTPGYTARAVIDIDCSYGARLAAQTQVPVATVSPGGRAEADWRATAVGVGAVGSSVTLAGPGGASAELVVRLPGGFNVDNAVAAYVGLVEAGVDPQAAAAGIGELRLVPGRMERVDEGQPFLAVVDFAHTPEAVSSLLAALREVTRGRLIAVLGCGGDRDRGKRALMGAALAAGADLAVLTSDNPRTEDPAAIVNMMIDGVRRLPAPSRGELVVELDRATAIEAATALARQGDTVVVAGKGHEQGQQIGSQTLPFDDRRVLAAAVRRLAGSGESSRRRDPGPQL
jgi:UDP-N-acetylmuramoyl-L-alanyl-D-glutamate--2,6-diaminopimelate ligase